MSTILIVLVVLSCWEAVAGDTLVGAASVGNRSTQRAPFSTPSPPPRNAPRGGNGQGHIEHRGKGPCNSPSLLRRGIVSAEEAISQRPTRNQVRFLFNRDGNSVRDGTEVSPLK